MGRLHLLHHAFVGLQFLQRHHPAGAFLPSLLQQRTQ